MFRLNISYIFLLLQQFIKYLLQQIQIKSTIMDNNIQLKIKYKGRVLLVSVNKARTLQQVITSVRSKQPMLSEVPMYTMNIKNINTAEILQWSTQIDCIRISDTGKREILIYHDQDANKCMSLIDNVDYDIQSQYQFKDCLNFVLNNDIESISELKLKRKISEELYQLLIRIQRKITKDKQSGNQKQKQDKSEEIRILLQCKLENVTSTCKNLQNKLEANDRIVKDLQAKLKNKQDEINKFKNQIQKQNKIIQQRDQQIKIIQLNINKLAQQSQSKISVDYKFSNSEKLSMRSLIALKYLQEQIHTKIVSNNEHYEQIILQTHKSILEQSQKKGNTVQSILYKSKTYQSQFHHASLSSHSQALRKFIEDLMGNKIKDVRSIFFMEKLTVGKFIEKLKNKPNFILLFTHGQTIFGVFSPQQMGSKKIRSQSGFLFNLSSFSIFRLKQKQSLWKQSNIQLKIGNDSLIMPEPIVVQNGMKMKKKKDIESAFQIKPEQINQIFHNKSQIIIDSFEMLDVMFEGQKNSMIKRISTNQSKVQEI